MTTAAGAFAAVKTRLTGGGSGISIPLRWQGEDGGDLPDTPSAFGYIEMIARRGRLAGYGGGRGSNLYRHPALIRGYVFTPNGDGLAVALTHAETICARLRSYRDSDISCFGATVHPGGHGAEISPPGLNSAVNAYWYAVAEIEMHYDLVG